MTLIRVTVMTKGRKCNDVFAIVLFSFIHICPCTPERFLSSGRCHFVRKEGKRVFKCRGETVRIAPLTFTVPSVAN